MSSHLHSALTRKIIGQAYHVHNQLGWGYAEIIYEKALAKRLRGIGLVAERQHPIDVWFEEECLGDFRADILVENLVIVELKAVETVHAKYYAQTNNYIRSTEIEVGLLINFGPDGVEVTRKVMTNDRKPNLAEILRRRGLA